MSTNKLIVGMTGASGSTMRDFGDKSLASGLFLIDLLAAVEPRAVDRKLVTPGASEDERKLKAKCALPPSPSPRALPT